MTGRPHTVLAAIDDLLFEPDGWFAIDRTNRRVPRVTIPTRQAGLALVGRGPVATIVGRLRPQAVAIDIDLDDERGTRAADQLTAWCNQQRLWSLSRPSGRPGHRHVIVVPQGRQDELQALVSELRHHLEASPKQIDVRRTLRPLTAPHRLGGSPPTNVGPDSAADVLRRLTNALDADPAANLRLGRRASCKTSGALIPRSRPLTPLPERWERYLRDGVRPTLGGHDHSRSTYEAIATGALLRAGHTADTAWQQILAAHPDAMTKARASHRRWILHVWNRAVLDDTTFTPVANRNPQVLAGVAAARNRLWALLPGQRSRVSVLRVGLAILDRMERTGTLRVPVPERNLVLDTGITDRTTIRDALRQLQAHGVGALHTDTLAPGARRARTSFEFSVPAAEGPEIPPPGIHTPLPPTLWSVLPPTAALFWHYLETNPAGISAAQLLTGTRQTRPGAVPSRHQVDAAVDVLRELGRIGLATCDEYGTWHAAAPEPGDPHYQTTIAEADRTHRVRREQVETERAAYRSRVFSEWGRQRAAAIDKQRRRHQAWWDALGGHEQQRRRAGAATGFARHSPHDQARRTHQWASRRRAAGASEAERHDAWISSIPDEEYKHRAAHRARVYAVRPSHERWELAAAWAAHRREFGVGRGKQSPRRPDHGGPG